MEKTKEKGKKTKEKGKKTKEKGKETKEKGKETKEKGQEETQRRAARLESDTVAFGLRAPCLCRSVGTYTHHSSR